MRSTDDEETSKRRWDLLCTLHEETQTSIRALDDVCFKVKGWSFTVWTMGTGYAVQSGSRRVLVVSCCPILVFWLVDISYKFFHEQFMTLGYKIEKLLVRGDVTPDDLAEVLPGHQLKGRFFTGWLKPAAPLKLALQRRWHHAPYVALLLCSLLLGTLAIQPKRSHDSNQRSAETVQKR